MQITALIKMLRKFPPETEVRVAACTQPAGYEEYISFDLPIAGLSEEFAPASYADVRHSGDSVVWIVTSHTLPPPSKP